MKKKRKEDVPAMRESRKLKVLRQLTVTRRKRKRKRELGF